MATARKLPSGNWRCRICYTDEKGVYIRKSFTAPKKKEAELLAAQYLMEHQHDSKPENKTLGQLSDRFIENRYNLLSPSTIVGYKKIRNTAFKGIIDLRVGVLTKELYQAAVNEYSIGRSPKTVLSAHCFFNRVLKENHIHVAEGATIPQKEIKEIQIPTDEEVQSFLKEIEGTRIELLVKFAVYLGLRRSEAFAIKWKDIDYTNQTVLINKARVKNEFGEYVEKTTKNPTSTRRLKMPPPLFDSLPPKGENDEYVLSDNPETLDSYYKRTIKRSEFKYNLHALRHYYASVMLKMGIPNKYARERMGHATDNMLTNVYQHIFRDKQEEYDVVLSDFFSNKGNEKDTAAKDKEE